MFNNHSTVNGPCRTDRQEIDHCTEAFQAALNRGLRPSLEDYLPLGPDDATAVLTELVHVELEFHLKHGEAARVEEYFARYPQLAEDAGIVLTLVMAEYALRRREEHDLEDEEFLQRFPAYRDALAARIAEANCRNRDLGCTRTFVSHTTVHSVEVVDLLRLPDYEIIAVLGRGAMGIVYKAWQKSLKRLVALKMVRAGVFASTEERKRFHREGEVIARIQSAHVVQIHEFGEYRGQMYFSMELLEGGTLASKLNGQALPARAAAELVRTLAQAVQAAHQHGIVHRDLKPDNVLFAADGTVKITDFGLAKVLDDENSDTSSDAIMGTPAYMAPEQARGEIRKIGPAADVYALGAILYEALTGRPPFQAETRYQTLELVRGQEPEPPSRYRRGLSRDLEAICRKCLEKQQVRRYVSAEALADDLDRWLKGGPTQARPLGRFKQFVRLLRRHPRTSAAVCLLGLLFVLIPAVRWYGRVLSNKARPPEPAAPEANKLFARPADDAILQRLTATAQRNPEDMEQRWKRGEWYARHTRWKEAAGDFRIALERQPPDDNLAWLHAAPALAAGDREGYRWQCGEMLKRFGQTQDAVTAERIAKACLLLPEFAEDMGPACRLADRAAVQGKNHAWAPVFVICKGLADYRRGNFRAVVRELDPLTARTEFGLHSTTFCHLVLAMSLHRQAKAKAAREHLARAAKLLDQHLPDLTHFPVSGDGPKYNHDWLIAWLLHREAQMLIEGK